ncbi:MAG: hypothetical protein ACYCXG_11765 [Acidiferrobacter sp.]
MSTAPGILADIQSGATSAWDSLSSAFTTLGSDVATGGVSGILSSGWWNGTPQNPIGAKVYAGAVGAGLSADVTAGYHAAQAATTVGSDITTAVTASWGPILLIGVVIVIAVIVIKT